MAPSMRQGHRGTGVAVLRWVLFAAVFFSPLALGIFDGWRWALVAGALFVGTGWAVKPGRSRLVRHVALILLAACFTLTLAELIARPLLYYRFDYRPSNRYLYRWPPLPLLQRYVAGVDGEETVYGDTATASGRREWREHRRIRWVTDAHGFRNEPSATAPGAPPLDVIVLGDSFGVAAST